MKSTFGQVKNGDFVAFKECLNTFISWYKLHADEMHQIAEAWNETEDDALVSILSYGIREAHIVSQIAEEAEQ